MAMVFTPSNIAALIISASFAAGLNIYATILTLGILAHTQWVALPQGLEVLGQWWIIAVSGALFLAEFFADKIPGLDLAWNAAHTFVRVPVAALLAYRTAQHLSPGMQLLATAAGAGIAMIAHTSKTAVRTAITPSPEPVSNIALSTAEDGLAIGLTWLATQHPYVTAAISIVLIILAILAIRWIVRAVRRAWARLGWRGRQSTLAA